MPYAVRKKEAPGPGFLRIARQEAGRALQELKNPSLAPDQRIHEARKSCKRLRALLRLIRPQLRKTAKTENRMLRDAARRLSAPRDFRVMRDLHARLVKHSLTAAQARREASRLFPPAHPRSRSIPNLQRSLERFRKHTRKWDLEGLGWKKLAKGLARSRQRARKSRQRALKTQKDEELHEWRKQAKLLGYHLDLLRHHLRKKGKRLRREAKELGKLLGDDHDLAVFQAAVRDSPALSPARRVDLLHRAERRRRRLQQQAASIGRYPSRQTRLLCR